MIFAPGFPCMLISIVRCPSVIIDTWQQVRVVLSGTTPVCAQDALVHGHVHGHAASLHVECLLIATAAVYWYVCGQILVVRTCLLAMVFWRLSTLWKLGHVRQISCDCDLHQELEACNLSRCPSLSLTLAVRYFDLIAHVICTAIGLGVSDPVLLVNANNCR